MWCASRSQYIERAVWILLVIALLTVYRIRSIKPELAQQLDHLPDLTRRTDDYPIPEGSRMQRQGANGGGDYYPEADVQELLSSISEDHPLHEAFKNFCRDSQDSKDTREVRKRQDEAVRVGVLFAEALAAMSVERAQTTDLAFVTLSTDDAIISTYLRPLMINIMYAVCHGYAYIMQRDVSNFTVLDIPLSTHYFKMQAIRMHLRSYKAVVYLDLDVVILQQGPKEVFHNILYSVPELQKSDLIMADHYAAVNAGVLLFRSSPWSERFIASWWNKSATLKKFYYSDNSVIWLSIVDEIVNSTETRPSCPDPVSCESEKETMSNKPLCFIASMDCRGYTYDNRIGMGKVSLLPQNVSEYRINQWFFTSYHPYKHWADDDYYRAGDPVAHSKYHSVLVSDEEYKARLGQASACLLRGRKGESDH